VCPEPLKEHLELWHTYALHEFLAFSLEVFLGASVEQVGRLEFDAPAHSVAKVSEKLSGLLPREFARRSLGDLLQEAHVPTQHLEEIALRSKAKEALQVGDLGAAVAYALRLLARIAARLRRNPSCYGSFLPDTPIDSHRLGLNHLTTYLERQASLPLAQVAQYWLSLAASTHMRVATAKLAYNKDFTYKIAFENGALRKVMDTEPAFSQPRLEQATQMLADVGLLRCTEKGYLITPEGIDQLRSYQCSI